MSEASARHFRDHFVTDGIESAVKQAKAAAGAKSVGVHGADAIQQLWNAGLLDEIHVAGMPTALENPTVIAGVGVTYLRYPAGKGVVTWQCPGSSTARTDGASPQ
jgi:dihydrofolate reductase